MRSVDLSLQEIYVQSLWPHSEGDLFEKAAQASSDLHKSSIQLSSQEGRLISFLIRSHACQKFVEIGTLTGFSALWILQGMSFSSECLLHTFEKNPQHAMAAQKVFDQHPLSKSIHLHCGDAEVELSKIVEDGPFDGIFIDGNKSAYSLYLDWAEQNLKKGGLILADNVFLGGAVYDEQIPTKFSSKNIEGMRSFHRRLADTSRYASTLIPTSEGLFAAVKLF
jgi:predicted O-methyltransferase YrrM